MLDREFTKSGFQILHGICICSKSGTQQAAVIDLYNGKWNVVRAENFLKLMIKTLGKAGQLPVLGAFDNHSALAAGTAAFSM